MLKKIVAIFSGLVVGIGLLVTVGLIIGALIIYPRLPSLDILTQYQPQMPLKIFTADGKLMGEFGEEHRSLVEIKNVPEMMKKAILAAEDERFYDHHGIDYIGVVRALFSNIILGRTYSGASTITMQVARNFFLSSEKTFIRKFNEVLLAFKIERSLTKNQILALYINQIYLGQHAYGFAAAGQTYFGKPLEKLSVAEMAMLAGLPKAPSIYNPITSFKRAKQRQTYVLDRMAELEFITPEECQAAKDEVMVVRRDITHSEVPGSYAAEWVRQELYKSYGEAIYTEGYRVYTTIDSEHQEWAFKALRDGLMNFDRRLAYRGPVSHLELSHLPSSTEEQEIQLDKALSLLGDDGDLQPGVVMAVKPEQVSVYLQGGQRVNVYGSGLSYVRHALSTKIPEAKRIRPGAVIYLRANLQKGQWEITQMPEVEGAFVSMETRTGAIKSLVGGFNFQRRSFNHVTQAWRQPGSTFKPFIYSAAIDKGMTISTPINDAPLLIKNGLADGGTWAPKNADGLFGGLMTLRQGLTWSRNLVSVRVLMAIGVDYSRQYIAKFGFMPDHHPASLSMALGSGSVTPLQMAKGYAVFANGGYSVKPYLIDRIEDKAGRLLIKNTPEIIRAIDPRNAYIMTNMLGDVVRYGTAVGASKLGRSDLGGKTGTTNDFKDSWFAGFNPHLVAVAWVGYDLPRSLGRMGFGGIAALPIWVQYMADALKNEPNIGIPQPHNLIVKGDGIYYQEYPHTHPGLYIDNSGTVPEDQFGLDNASGEIVTPNDTFTDSLLHQDNLPPQPVPVPQRTEPAQSAASQ